MKSKTLFLTGILLSLFCVPQINAQIPVRVNQTNFSTAASQIICEYPGRIGIGEQEIVSFLESLVQQTTPGTVYYSPPIPEIVTSSIPITAFQWTAVPFAGGYGIGSLRLGDGYIDNHATVETTYNINDLEDDLYLFAFWTEGPDVHYKDLIIIIDDKDLGITNVQGIPCLCMKQEETIAPIKPNETCAIERINTIDFPWLTNDCVTNKYTYDIDGVIEDHFFSYSYSFLYKQGNQFQKDSVYNFSDCNASFPILQLTTPNQGQMIVPVALKIGINQDRIRFEYSGNSITNFKVTAKDCGCYTAPSKVPGGKGIASKQELAWSSNNGHGLQLTPNPFSERIMAQINLLSSQTIVLQVFDLNGKLMEEKVQTLEKGKHQLQLSTDGFNPGLYQVRLKTSEQIYSQKVLKL